MDARLDEIGGPTTYAMYPVGWALAMNTPYQWTKQVASHFGGTRDGLVVHWPAGIAPAGRSATSSTTSSTCCPRVLDAAGLPLPETVEGVPSSAWRGRRCATASTTPTAEERRRTQYFEMVGNRGIYHEGWTAVTRHGVPWKMTEEPRPFDDDTWELYDTAPTGRRPTTSRADDPERLARLQALFDEEAEKHQVFPLDDRVTERENPELAGRLRPAPRPHPRGARAGTRAG